MVKKKKLGKKRPAKKAARKKVVKRKVVKRKAPARKKPVAHKRPEHCCDRVRKRDWELKEYVWKDKAFFVVRHGLFFHIPINFGGAVKTALGELESRKYRFAKPFMMLERETGWFTGKLMVAIQRPREFDPNVEHLSGTFISKVFQGPYSQLGKPIQELSEHIRKKRGVRPTEFYLWYNYCPRCAPRFGGTQTVIFARLK